MEVQLTGLIIMLFQISNHTDRNPPQICTCIQKYMSMHLRIYIINRQIFYICRM